MNKFLLAAALGALLAGPALAQDRDHRGGNGNGRGEQNHAAPAPAAQPQPNFNRGSGMSGPHPGDSMAGPRPGGSMAGPRPNNPAFNGPRPGNNNFAGPRPGNNFAGPRPGPRPDFRAFNRNFTAPHRFRGPAYIRPPGFVYRRWVFGDFLPSIYWSNNYWLYDFADFDLPPPPPGTVWVRYGSDALLIDRFSGEIIEVDYNVFY